MSNTTDYKLILISDNTDKVQIRYRKRGDAHFSTLFIEPGNVDNIIETFISSLEVK